MRPVHRSELFEAYKRPSIANPVIQQVKSVIRILYDVDVTMLQLVFLSLVGLAFADLDHSKFIFSLLTHSHNLL